MGRSAPRPAAVALRAALERTAPRTDLAAWQAAWPAAVGPAVAAAAEPVAESDGVLTVRCHSATWAQELSLMEAQLLERLAGQISGVSPRAIKVLVG
jgi:predicted nucleic acid-binding Zn ribbon protein